MACGSRAAIRSSGAARLHPGGGPVTDEQQGAAHVDQCTAGARRMSGDPLPDALAEWDLGEFPLVTQPLLDLGRGTDGASPPSGRSTEVLAARPHRGNGPRMPCRRALSRIAASTGRITAFADGRWPPGSRSRRPCRASARAAGRRRPTADSGPGRRRADHRARGRPARRARCRRGRPRQPRCRWRRHGGISDGVFLQRVRHSVQGAASSGRSARVVMFSSIRVTLGTPYRSDQRISARGRRAPEGRAAPGSRESRPDGEETGRRES
ncbi:hypothetical protein SBADM41S_11249 [Streptomyces badius]